MNKFYIQIVFFLLSVSLYLNNKTLATEPAPGKDTKSKSKNPYSTSEEIYEQNKHLLCTNLEEIENTEKLMNEAVTHLEYHATCEDGYESYEDDPECSSLSYYKKKHEDHTDVLKANYKFYESDVYNGIAGLLWDPHHADFSKPGSIKRKIVRVYNPNLVMIQQRYKSWFGGREKYFYALLKKAQIEDATIIVMASANVNDHNPSENKYKNTIIKSANLFTTDIDSEDDIRKGKLKKVFVNIAGYLIENKSIFVNMTYVESIDGYASF
ncbi:fam-a protein [Plasmodium vinckei lentum]|uniref:Fam-a protein n=1 Tax=Plasmodium vinckei lentum TaxID=138297 RepID=A0A6V7S0G6_PLAVN|nr:fam-a protein [Plasmodium vinckei lentum]